MAEAPRRNSLTLAEAQALPSIRKRPSYLQRYPGPNAPLREIVHVGHLGSFGRWVLLECDHWREIRDYDLLPLMGRPKPKKSRCGLCRDGIGTE